MSKHTPGPWKLDNYGFIETVDSSNDGWQVVTEYAGCGSHECAWPNEANIALVLAAPLLFEALRDLLAEAEDGIATCPLTRAAARAAIAAATGENA